MIQNYLKIILRSLWKNRLFTILNITGLAVGISASWIIFRICTYEYSYNKSFSDRKSIFKVRTEFDFNGQSGNNEGITRPLYPLIKHEVTGISNVVPTFGFHVEKIKIPVKNKEHKIQEFNTFANASADFFDVFAFPIIAGNSKCLGSKDQMAISAEYADLFFGNIPLNDIIGQSIVLNDSLHFQVGAIFANTTKPSDITFKAYIPIDKSKIKEDEWANVNSSDQLYIKLDPASNHIDILKSINTLADSRSEQYLKFWGENTKRWFELTPLDEVHFMTNLGSNIRKANKNVLFILIGVAFFLLLLACINYINISVANLPNKSKEIGLKKTLGVSSTKIFIDYTIETGIILTMSTIMSFGLSELLYKAYPFLIPEGMSTYKDFPLYVAFLLCFLVLTTLITSIVPAWKMNQMQASDIIKNNFSTSQQGSVLTLNKSMVVFQFFIASVFIISSLIINRQINHLMTMDIGFEKMLS
jgi:putative ABC transport system permease protein